MKQFFNDNDRSRDSTPLRTAQTSYNKTRLRNIFNNGSQSQQQSQKLNVDSIKNNSISLK